MVMVAARLREPVTLVDATRLLRAIDGLESTRTWKDLDDAAKLVFREIGELEVALEHENRPHLAGRSMGSLAP
jgi:alpha-beta hydrolase superfamily lysophospholipase